MFLVHLIAKLVAKILKTALHAQTIFFLQQITLARSAATMVLMQILLLFVTIVMKNAVCAH